MRNNYLARNINGFTLMELMITIVIVGLLAAIAIPSYLNYTQRTRFSEIIVSTEPYKVAVTIALQDGEPITQLNSGVWGIPASPTSNNNIASITVNQGVITATSTVAAGNATYILTPDDTGSQWTISGTCLEKGLCKQ